MVQSRHLEVNLYKPMLLENQRVIEIHPRIIFYVYCYEENRVLFQALKDDEITRGFANIVASLHDIVHPGVEIVECYDLE